MTVFFSSAFYLLFSPRPSIYSLTSPALTLMSRGCRTTPLVPLHIAVVEAAAIIAHIPLFITLLSTVYRMQGCGQRWIRQLDPNRNNTFIDLSPMFWVSVRVHWKRPTQHFQPQKIVFSLRCFGSLVKSNAKGWGSRWVEGHRNSMVSGADTAHGERYCLHTHTDTHRHTHTSLFWEASVLTAELKILTHQAWPHCVCVCVLWFLCKDTKPWAPTGSITHSLYNLCSSPSPELQFHKHILPEWLF